MLYVAVGTENEILSQPKLVDFDVFRDNTMENVNELRWNVKKDRVTITHVYILGSDHKTVLTKSSLSTRHELNRWDNFSIAARELAVTLYDNAGEKSKSKSRCPLV